MAPTIDRIRFVVDENLLRMGRAIARRLVKWENIGDEALYKAAHAEIVKSGGGYREFSIRSAAAAPSRWRLSASAWRRTPPI